MNVVVIDEIDQLLTQDSEVLYNIFEWTQGGCNLVVVGIANTINLCEKLKPQTVSRMGCYGIIFRGYDKNQLVKIILGRLQGVEIFRK